MTPDPTTQPARPYYCAQCGNRLGEVAAACSDCPRLFCGADCNDAHDCLRRRPDPTTHCIHCGRVCGDYDGGTASVEDMPLCHPNAVGRPDCYRMVTVYGHPLIACKQCAPTTEADPAVGPCVCPADGSWVAAWCPAHGQKSSTQPAWRTVLTDSESESGVAPVCEAWEKHPDPEPEALSPEDPIVYECCPGPHLQCVNARDARELTTWLNQHGVEVCS